MPFRRTFNTELLVPGPERKFNAEAVTTANLNFLAEVFDLSLDCSLTE
jgi:hypothetical protein